MKTSHLRPAPGTTPTTETRDRWKATCWTTAKGLHLVAMPLEDGDWEIWSEKMVEVEDGEPEVQTSQIAPDVDCITAEELAAIIG